MLQNFRSDVAFRGLSVSPFEGSSPSTLGARTLIYGRNGSGKTSLSEVLRLCPQRGTADSSQFTARTFAQGASTSVKLTADEFPWQIFVYNRYYIQDSLELFLDGNGSALPILKLGLENVRAEESIREKRNYLNELQSRNASLEASSDLLLQQKESIEAKVKTEVISALGPVDPGNFNTARYRVTRVRELLTGDNAQLLTDSELTLERAFATQEPRIEVKVLRPPEMLPVTLRDSINSELLAFEVDSVPLSRLEGNPRLSQWVEDGLELNQEGMPCEFCQSGVISKTTLDLYRQHFSHALNDLRERLRATIEVLEISATKWKDWLLSFPSEDAFLPDYTQQAKLLHIEINAKVDELLKAHDYALELLRRRLADPLHPLPSQDRILHEFPNVDGSKYMEVISANNLSVQTQAARVNRARAAIEAHLAGQEWKKYQSTLRRLELTGRAKQAIGRRSDSVDSKISRLRESQQNVGFMAQQIDRDLTDHFGHSHLRVGVSPDGKGYLVTRDKMPAERLSEGERNAIALTYFLRSLEEEGVTPSSSIVVIDDPMTSLDKEALFATFALINARTDEFAQTILLTHDYEYFRLHLMDLRQKWFSSQKRIREGNQAEMAFPSVSILEMRAVRPSSERNREGALRTLPRGLIRHASEYHYLFHCVAEAVIESNDNPNEYLPLIGNAGRRLLEGFLSFRAPDKNKFQEKVEAVPNLNSPLPL